MKTLLLALKAHVPELAAYKFPALHLHHHQTVITKIFAKIDATTPHVAKVALRLTAMFAATTQPVKSQLFALNKRALITDAKLFLAHLHQPAKTLRNA